MTRYAIKRILITIPILLGVIFIVFALMEITPGDPATNILGPYASQEAIEALNHQLGYDQPFFIKFFNYIKDIVTKFDFGTSYRTQQPVMQEIMMRFPTTLKLALLSILFSTLLGTTLGIISAVKQYSMLDTVLSVTALAFAAIPSFWLSLTLIRFFAVKWSLLPTSGAETWLHFILPLLSISIGGTASMLRMTRSAMLETIRADYIRTARAKGASEKRVIISHALKNALLPVITVAGMNFGGLLGGAVITETVFSMPGVGMYLVTAIRQKNLPVVLSSTLFLAALFCLVMLGVDLLYAAIDPRIREKFKKG